VGNESVEIDGGGAGSAILGTRTRDVQGQEDEENIAILGIDATNTNFQEIPAPASGELLPGLVIADGQNFGRFLFGGVVTGQVIIGGSIDTFYSGWLMTGVANSQFGQPAELLSDNF